MKKKMEKLKYLLNTAEISAWLLQSRESLKLSQGKAADAIGVTQMYLSTIERGSATLINIDHWKKISEFYLSKGATPLKVDPLSVLPDPPAMRKEIQEMRDTTKSPLKAIAATLGIGASSLTNFMSGEGLKPAVMYALRDALVKLKAKPAELVKEQALEEKPVKRKYKKRSLIEQAPTMRGLPSLAELDMMELQLIQRMRARHEQVPGKPKHLNGHRH